MKFLWVIDPWDTLDHGRDTTLRLVEEGLKLGHLQAIADVRTIQWQAGRAMAEVRRVRRVRPARGPRDFELSTTKLVDVTEFEQIHYRPDPPVDLAWVQPLQILWLGTRDSRKCRIVNPAEVLFAESEKLAASRLPRGCTPETYVGSDAEDLLRAGRKLGRAVLKPLHQAQSKGIELLDFRRDLATARRILKRATDNHTRPVQLQKFLPGIAQGELRLWFIDGTPLGALRKFPVKGDFRVNMDGGSRLAPAGPLTARERRTRDALSKFLRASGIRLAAVDLIEGYATDINFTSPGLIVGMEEVMGENLARRVIEALARK